MLSNKALLRISIGIFVLLLLGGLFAFLKSQGYISSIGPGSTEPPGDEVAYIDDFKVQKPNFLVTGANLGLVDIWYVPATGAPAQLLGKATFLSGDASKQAWTMPIPQRVQAVEIFARGYDGSGTPVAKMSLPAGQSPW